MPVIEVKGDLLESDCQIIAHGCNCFHTMGSGIARSIRSKYPDAFSADLTSPYGLESKLGSYTYVQVGFGTNERYVLNLYTQFRFGMDQVHLNYEALFKCLEGLKAFAASRNLKVGIPRIGCGLAGGDWNAVKAIINYVFHDKDIYVYSL